MNRATRTVATLAAAAIAGVLLWAASHFERTGTYSYWAAYGIVAAAGLVIALSQMRGRRGNPPLMFALVFLPVLIAAGSVLLAMQPNGNWFRAHALAWSGDLGVRHLVEQLGAWLGVLAFGIGYTLGLTLEPAPAPAAEVVAPPAYDRKAADEPLTAERREVTADERGVTEDGGVTGDERAEEAQPVR